MTPEQRRLLAELQFFGAVTDSEVLVAEQRIGGNLPPAYRAFLLETGGGEGFVGEHGYARFFSPVDLISNAERYQADTDLFEQFEDLLIFGSNMGGTAYCFDPAGNVVEADWIAGRDDNRFVGPFDELLRRLDRGSI